MDKKDKKIRDILEDQKFSLDKVALWDDLSPHLPKRKRRGALIFYFLGALLVVLGGMWGYSLFSTDLNTPAVLSPIVVKHESPAVQEVEAATVEPDQTGILDEVRVNEDGTEGVSDVSLDRIKPRKKINSPGISSNDDLALLTDLPQSRKIVNQTTQEMAKDSKLEEWRATSGSLIPETAKNNELTRKLHNYSYLHLPHPILVGQASDFKMDLDLREHRKGVKPLRERRLSLIAAGGANLSLVNWKGTRGDFNDRGLVGSSFSLAVSYQFKNRWSISGGLNYNHLIARYENTEMLFGNGAVEGLPVVNIDALGQEEARAGEVKTTTITSSDLVWHRRHQSYDLALKIQKDFLLLRRLRLGVQAGMDYNFLTLSRGYVPDFSDGYYGIEKIEMDKGQYYQRSWGLKPSVGLELGYAIQGFEIILRGGYTHTLNPINSIKQNYQINHSQAGIQLGTRYYLQGNKN